MARRSPPRKVTYFEPLPPRLARKSTSEVGRLFRLTMGIDCGQLDPGAVIRPVPGEWHPRSRSASTMRSLRIGVRPQCGLSADYPHNRRAPCGR
jgi:hypothetical protein